MERYVVGFAFNKGKSLVLLMRKNHPPWQDGLLNGIGGKIEKEETAIQAMHRECKEETGLVLEWESRGIMRGLNNNGHPFECWIFYAYSGEVYNFKQLENEPLALYISSRVHREKALSNVRFLVPFGQHNKGEDNEVLFMTLEY